MEPLTDYQFVDMNLNKYSYKLIINCVVEFD